ncbi:odorant receptor 46a-like [Melitaea cinxia]|uniref:odorant receptor 46a-like n=1 Tax=Melitaea cinxia TaxID=113334 RepID=UPI001E26E916|nr:odorant receptor 46a-like [Melitaea cinxia]
MNLLKQTSCFNKNVIYWKLLGIYPLKVEWKFYNWYSKIFVSIFVLLFDGLHTINFYFMKRNLDNFIEEMIFYFTELSVMSKALTFMLMRERIKTILEILDSETFQPKSEVEMQLITNAKNFNVKYWKIVAVVSYCSYIFHIVYPFIVHFLLQVPLILPVCSYSFLPERFTETFLYPLYIYQALGIHMNMLYNINIDTFFLGLMILIIAQLKILEKKLMTVTDICKKHKYNNILYPKNGQSSEKNMINQLNKLIIHYDEVTKFCALVERVFSVTLFVQFSVSSCIICVCLFRFTLPAPVHYYIFLATYMFVMMIQIMVPSLFGTQMITKSCLLSQAIYGCDWTGRSRRFKSSLKLFVERANRPLSITGWKMFPLSLNTFTYIINSAYSFFTVLRYMQTKET